VNRIAVARPEPITPFTAETTVRLNTIKQREGYRPIAPIALESDAERWFVGAVHDPYMLFFNRVTSEELKAVTHVDGSGRLQTVSREMNPRYYQLIEDFYKLTGVPVVLNTSFNENEPIVCTPRDAIDCFLKTKMDVLYIGNHVVRR